MNNSKKNSCKTIIVLSLMASLNAAATSLDTWGWGVDVDPFGPYVDSNGVAFSSTNQFYEPNFSYHFWKSFPNTAALPGWWALNQPPQNTINPLPKRNINPIDVATGFGSTFLLNADGTIVCCGRESSNQFGGSNPFPQQVGGTPFLLKYPNGQIVKNVIQIADSGHSQSKLHAAVLADGTVITWGIDPITNTPRPVGIVMTQLGPVKNAKQVEVTRSAVFILTGEGKVLSYGVNTSGNYLGRMVSNDEQYPKEVQAKNLGNGLMEPLQNIKQIATGLVFTGFLDGLGRVWTVGENAQSQRGQIADPATNPYAQLAYSPVGFATGAKHIACAQTCIYVLLGNGKVIGWGENGQNNFNLGQPSTVQHTAAPVAIHPNTLGNIIDIRASTWGAYFLRDDGTIVALGFGNNNLYHLPGWTLTAPPPNPHLLKFQGTNLNLNYINTGIAVPKPQLVLRLTGSISGAGEKQFFGNGSNSTLPIGMAQPLSGQPGGPKKLTFRQLTTDRLDTVGSTSNNSYAVGIDFQGLLQSCGTQNALVPALGQGNTTPLSVFKPINTAPVTSARFIQVESHGGSTIALTSTGELVGWGKSPLPLQNAVKQASPVKIPTEWETMPTMSLDGSIIKIAVAEDCIYALLTSGLVAYTGRPCGLPWGSNTSSLMKATLPGKWRFMIGAGTSFKNDPNETPELLFSLLLAAVDIAAVGENLMVQHSNGTVTMYGANQCGQISNPNLPLTWGTNSISSSRLRNVKGIAIAGGRPNSASPFRVSCYALTTDGVAYSWGSNSNHGLGRNFNSLTLDQTIKPVLGQSGIPLGNIRSIDAGVMSGFASLSDGTTVSWGSNLKGGLGQGVSASFSNVAKPVVMTNTGYRPTAGWKLGVGSNAVSTLFQSAQE